MRNPILIPLLALTTLSLAAQDGASWVGLQGGYAIQNNSSRNAKDNPILGLAGGTWFSFAKTSSSLTIGRSLFLRR